MSTIDENRTAECLQPTTQSFDIVFELLTLKICCALTGSITRGRLADGWVRYVCPKLGTEYGVGTESTSISNGSVSS